MDLHTNSIHEMSLLEQIESDPDVTQASLATRLGVAVGTVNWHLKRLIAKGYVKVKRAERRKLRYIITPEGIAFRARLTVDYVEQSLLLYRSIRQRVSRQLEDVRLAGYDQVHIDGEGDIADICRLTCLEQGIPIVGDSNTQTYDEIIPYDHTPVLEVSGLKVILHMDNKA
jgi:DNA-binding MarR family transcriptional regulator